MSNTNKVAKKTVKINENDLVNLIDNILEEAIEIKKKEWIAEQDIKDKEKNALFESRLSALEAKLNPAKK